MGYASRWTGGKQLTDIFFRSTLTNFYNNCRLTGGILQLVGWSQDSQWVAFLASPEKSTRIKPQLYLVNINSGESHFFPNVWYAKWMPDSNVLLEFKKDVVEIINVENDISITSLQIPTEIQAENVVFDGVYIADLEMLWLISRSRANSYNTPRSLWSVDAISNEWHLHRDVDLGVSASELLLADNVAFFCKTNSGSKADIVEVRKYPSWESLNEVDSDCDSLRYLFDDEGNTWAGNFISLTQKSIQVSNLQSSTIETLIDWESTNISNPRQVASFDWFLPKTIPHE